MTRKVSGKKKLLLRWILLTLIIQCCIIDCSISSDKKIRKIIEYRVQERLKEKYSDFLADRNPEVRCRLALEFSAYDDTCLVDPLIKLLNDNSPLVRNMAAYSLGNFDCEKSREALLNRMLVEKDPDVCQEILFSIGKVGREENLRELVLKYRVEDELLMASLVEFFKRGIYTEGRVNFLLNKLKNGSLKEKELAAKILLFASDSVQINMKKEVVLKLFRTNSQDLPLYAIKLAAKYQGINKSIIRNALNHPDRRAKLEIAKNIKGYKAYKDFWNKCLQDTDKIVKAAAIEYLYKNCNDIEENIIKK